MEQYTLVIYFDKLQEIGCTFPNNCYGHAFDIDLGFPMKSFIIKHNETSIKM